MMCGWSRSRRAAGVAVAVLVLAGCTGDEEPAPPQPSAEPPPPVGLRLLVEGVEYDADTGAGRTVGVTSWLRPVTGPPILLVESSPASSPSSGAQIGSVTVTRAETGAAPTLQVSAPAGSYPRLAAAADGRGVWVSSESPLGRVSPDARYALVRLGNHSVSPQVIDLWLLDLTTGAWQQVPGMPVTGALKSASETWASDGRVVMLGEYGLTGPVLATWRPGDREVARRPDPLPRRVYEQGLGPLLVTATS